MKTKFTKGEWKYSLNKNQIQVVIPTSFPTTLILGRLSSDDCSHPQCCKVEEHSNAKLIAAAPGMFKSLMNIIEHLKTESGLSDSDIDFVLEQTGAKNAIKKATE